MSFQAASLLLYHLEAGAGVNPSSELMTQHKFKKHHVKIDFSLKEPWESGVFWLVGWMVGFLGFCCLGFFKSRFSDTI